MVAMSFRTILSLGYHITMDKPPSRIRAVRLPNDPFLQSNGYKPAPLDLGDINLSGKLEELIDQLAENTHNVWAKERILQGWTYGLNEVHLDCFLFSIISLQFIFEICQFQFICQKKKSPRLFRHCFKMISLCCFSEGSF